MGRFARNLIFVYLNYVVGVYEREAAESADGRLGVSLFVSILGFGCRGDRGVWCSCGWEGVVGHSVSWYDHGDFNKVESYSFIGSWMI